MMKTQTAQLWITGYVFCFCLYLAQQALQLTWAVVRQASRSFTASAKNESCRPLALVRGENASLALAYVEGGDGVLGGFGLWAAACGAEALRSNTLYSA